MDKMKAMTHPDLSSLLKHTGIPARPVMSDSQLARLAESQDDPRLFVERYKAALKARRAKVRALARQIGVTQQRLAPSKIASLNPKLLMKISTILDVDWSWLTRGFSDAIPDFLFEYVNLSREVDSVLRSVKYEDTDEKSIDMICKYVRNLTSRPDHKEFCDLVRVANESGEQQAWGMLDPNNHIRFNRFCFYWAIARLESFPMVIAGKIARSTFLRSSEHTIKMKYSQIKILQEALRYWCQHDEKPVTDQVQDDIGELDHRLKYAGLPAN